ncbi:hypothetical protein ACPYO6_05250 [Georgenia sp. Z1344]|uniref:hypothetical protein n=1 Tax=Georgenia sp. Z1344 TaxID=3416706 RepID=UPI003CED1279
MGGLTRPVAGDRPDPPVPPDPVEAEHVTSSRDGMDVDPDEVRGLADELDEVAEGLRAAAAPLRLVGSTPQHGGRILVPVPNPGHDPLLAADLVAVGASAQGAADTIDTVAGRVADLASGLRGWAEMAERADGGAGARFRVLGALSNAMGLPRVITGRVLATPNPAGWFLPGYGVLTNPGWAARPGGPGIAAALDAEVAAAGGAIDLAADATGTSPLLTGVQGDPAAGETAALAALPLARALSIGSPGGARAVLDDEPVPGLLPVLAGATGLRVGAPPGSVVADARGGPGAPGGPGGPGAPGSLLSRRPAPGRTSAVLDAARPGSVADLVRRVDPLHAESGRENRPHLEVLRTEHADGSTSFVVVIPGTSGDATVADPDNLMDNASNIELAATGSSALMEGISEALELAGARDGDAVGMIGHSQGGLGVAHWAAGDDARRYDLRTSVALNAPIAHAGAPVAGHHMSVDVADDAVSGLDGAPVPHIDPNAATGSRSAYTVDTSTRDRDLSEVFPFEGHYPEHSAAAWAGVVEHRGHDPGVVAVQEEFAYLLGAGEEGAVTTSVVVELEREG